jgi:hypothetical protein
MSGCLFTLLLLLVFVSLFVADCNPWNQVKKIAPPVPLADQGIHFIGGEKTLKRRGDIVFIHGLDGDAWETWGNKTAEFYWPKWLSERYADVGVWCVKYDASSSEWQGNPMGIGDRSESILAQMRHKGIGQRPILLICHSLGGIVAKRMIVDSAIRTHEMNVQFINQIKGIAFLATPHSGSDAGTLAKIIKLYQPSPLVHNLDKDDDALRSLNNSYRDVAPRRNIATLPLVEKYDEPVVGRVVTESSADPGMGAEVKAIPVNETHRTISKPKTADSDVVMEVCLFIDRYLLPTPEASSTSLEDFEAEFNMAKDSGNFEPLRRKYKLKQFTWEAYVRVSSPQRENESDSHSIFALALKQNARNTECIIAAEFPRFSESYKDLKVGSKIKLKGVFDVKTSVNGAKLKDCELLEFHEEDRVR